MLVLPRASMVLIGVGGLVVFVSLDVVVATYRSNSLSVALENGLGFGLACGVCLAIVACRVEAVSASPVRVVNFFRYVAVDVPRISQFEVDEGLVIRLSNGRLVPCVVVGSSLWGEIFGYRRAAVAAEKCNTWLAAVKDPGVRHREEPLGDYPRYSYRLGGVVGVMLCGGIYVLGALALWHLAH